MIAMILLLAATPADGLAARLGPPKMPSYTQHPADNRLGVNVAELRLKAFGGYDGERLGAVKLKLYRRLGPSTLYADRHGHLYADRDGDAVIDACATYVLHSNLVTADWNCDGKSEQILAHVKL